MNQVLDVVIIGAGVSGVGMACRLKTEQPQKSFVVLERRQRVGGTWDLFRYPGVRSDSDMFTYGFEFKPWRDYRTLADGTSIQAYLSDTVKELGVAERIEYGLQCTAADWDSAAQLWTVTATHEPTGETRTYRARFVVSCQGYYNHDQGHRPEFAGEAEFKGQIVHPQQWPANLDYAGKNVVVIGSGATARDAGAGAGRESRQSDHAATLAHLHLLAAWLGPHDRSAGEGAAEGLELRHRPETQPRNLADHVSALPALPQGDTEVLRRPG